MSWEAAGSREDLWEVIGKRTKIPRELLKDRKGSLDGILATYPACRKLAWAADRQTTRIEDRAYSLFGLFGVNMPLLYGEGHKAFERLQEEILDVGTDLSILAWEPTQFAVDCRLFAESPDQYAGCSDMELSGSREQQSKEGLIISLTNIGLRIENPRLLELCIGGIKMLALNLGCHDRQHAWDDAVLKLMPLSSPLCRVECDMNMGVFAAGRTYQDSIYNRRRTAHVNIFEISPLTAWPTLIITRGEAEPSRRRFDPVHTHMRIVPNKSSQWSMIEAFPFDSVNCEDIFFEFGPSVMSVSVMDDSDLTAFALEDKFGTRIAITILRFWNDNNVYHFSYGVKPYKEVEFGRNDPLLSMTKMEVSRKLLDWETWDGSRHEMAIRGGQLFIESKEALRGEAKIVQLSITVKNNLGRGTGDNLLRKNRFPVIAHR